MFSPCSRSALTLFSPCNARVLSASYSHSRSQRVLVAAFFLLSQGAHRIILVFIWLRSPRTAVGRIEPFPGRRGRGEATAQEGPARPEHGHRTPGRPAEPCHSTWSDGSWPQDTSMDCFLCGPRAVHRLRYRCTSLHMGMRTNMRAIWVGQSALGPDLVGHSPRGRQATNTCGPGGKSSSAPVQLAS